MATMTASRTERSWRSAVHIPSALALSIAILLSGCASTSVVVEPPSQAPICAASETAVVVWAPWWRVDQKDVAAREAAVAAGLAAFFNTSGCFAHADIRRVAALPATVAPEPTSRDQGRVTRRVGVEVRELGPVVKLLGSAALLEGGTEVVLRVVEYGEPHGAVRRQFMVHWKNGGPGVVKGVATLADDMREALRTSFQPGG